MSGEPEDAGFLGKVTVESFSKWTSGRSNPSRREAGRRDKPKCGDRAQGATGRMVQWNQSSEDQQER